MQGGQTTKPGCGFSIEGRKGDPGLFSPSTCAGGLGVVVFTAYAERAPSHTVGQGSTSTQPRQVGGCGFEPSWLKLPNPESRGPRALRPVENPPTAHRANALANLAWLYSQPTRSTLHPTPLAEAPLQHNLARSVAVASNIHGYSFRIPCRAARARFAPWRTHRPPTEHARAGGLGVVVFAANAGRAPPRAVGRGSSSPTQKTGQRLRLRNVMSIAFEFCAARPARALPCGEPADRPQSKCAGGLGVVVFAANAERDPSHAVGRGSNSTQPRLVGGCGIEYS